jgi:hypothetical protein
MGVPGPHRHVPDICFCNPRCRHFKRDMYNQRVQKMKQEGWPVTNRLIALGDPPSDSVANTNLAESEAMLL